MKSQLLIIEDDPGIQSQLRWAFDQYEISVAEDAASALEIVSKQKPAVVTLDLGLPPDPTNATEGLRLLEKILKLAPDTKIVVVTGNDDNKNAVQAIAIGAYDFFQKPIEAELLGIIIERAYRLHDLEQQYKKLVLQNRRAPLDGMIAGSASMLKVCKDVEKLAPTNVTALILGESGTGKELIARAIHNLSDRKNKSFIAINCAAIPENLLESELFGYEKGAFTGANKQTKGKIEYADGGTFFLDEIGDLPLSLQAKILRFLQERVIERLGGRKEISVDVRVICATHRNLTSLIAEEKFREDLYYRISEISIKIPNLSEREGDALMIARVFLDSYKLEHRRNIKGFSKNAVAVIEAYSWPGNVRELENKVKRAVIMSDENYITAEDLDINVSVGDDNLQLDLRQIRESTERKAINRALTISGNSMSKAAELLGISRPTLYDLINKLNLK